ncbi:MAG: Rne/Rng family ribonuclease [Saprospiraceae bacterium]|nr:Rne/Rng family ribonuclease [Saprospiraceae bacterium]
MEKELVINSSPTEVEIALLENGKLVELHRQKTSVSFSVGDIFLGQIKKTMPSLNAAFMDIGSRKDAFLHYTDLGPQIKSLSKYTNDILKKKYNTHLLDNFEREGDNPKNGKIDNVFGKNEMVLVQVLKEPISTKGPRLSCEITLPGRYLVLAPFSDTVAVSKKIGSAEERKRLKVLVESIKPKGFGAIVRTAAEGKKVADLHTEIRELSEKWEKIYTELRVATEPGKLLSEIDKTQSILRDILSENFTKITVNSKEIYDGVRDFMKSVAPDKIGIVQMYKGSKPIFDQFEVSRQVKSSFGKTSTMPSGAYIVIEPTEAMHVIDVNSGPKALKRDQEDASLLVNAEAGEEIARQLRLRDIGGLIVIDFIDMRNNDSKVELFRIMKEFMKNDRAQHTILPLSKFGLMQITRQRVRPAVNIDTQEGCATCQGTGKSVPAILAVDNIVRDLEFILQNRPNAKLSIVAHPFLRAYLTTGFKSIQIKWFLKYRKWIKLSEDMDLDIFAYRFFDRDGDEIRLD